MTKLYFLQVRTDELRAEAVFLKSLDDFLFVVGAEGLHGDFQFYGGVTVGAEELVVVEADDISADVGDELGYAGEFARLIGKQDGDGKDTVSGDQAVLDNAGHGDEVHVAAA